MRADPTCRSSRHPFDFHACDSPACIHPFKQRATLKGFPIPPQRPLRRSSHPSVQPPVQGRSLTHQRLSSIEGEAAPAASRGRVSGGDGGGKQASRGTICTSKAKKVGGSLFGAEKRQVLSAAPSYLPDTGPRSVLIGPARLRAGRQSANEPSCGRRSGSRPCARECFIVGPRPATASAATADTEPIAVRHLRT